MHTPIVTLLCFFAIVCNALDPRWKLIFSDEFNGDTLDTTKWSARTQAGYPSQGELEYYFPDHVSVANGTLMLMSDPNPQYAGAYRSGWVDTSGKFSTTYGRYEVNAKFPPGKGTWPGHWLMTEMPFCWPDGTEIDIMESLGAHTSKIHTSIHVGTSCVQGQGATLEFDTGFDLSEGFHTYGIEWIPGQMTWFFDNTSVMVVTNTSVANIDLSPHYMILNTALGGWPGNPDPNDVWPQYHYIDYVRVYVWQPCVTGCNHGCCDGASMTCHCNNGYGGTNCEYEMSVPSFSPNLAQIDAHESVWGNAVLNNGQIQLIMANCTVGGTCANPPVSGGGWSSTDFFGYGNFTFVAQIPKVQGMILKMGGTHGLGVYSGFLFVFWNKNLIEVQTYNPPSWNDINLDFDISAGFHTYTMVYGKENFTLYIDNVHILDVPSCGVVLQMSLFWDYEPQYFGSYIGPPDATVLVSHADFVIDPFKGQCATVITPTSMPSPIPSSMPSHMPSTTSASKSSTTSATKSSTTSSMTSVPQPTSFHGSSTTGPLPVASSASLLFVSLGVAGSLCMAIMLLQSF